MNKQAIINRILEIVASQAMSSVEMVSIESRLYHDLKISGDDACELLDKISNEFGVKFEAYWVNQRFPTERDETSLLFWVKKKFGKNDTYVSVTTDDLVNYILGRMGDF